MWITSILGRCARLFNDKHPTDTAADTDQFDPYLGAAATGRRQIFPIHSATNTTEASDDHE